MNKQDNTEAMKYVRSLKDLTSPHFLTSLDL